MGNLVGWKHEGMGGQNYKFEDCNAAERETGKTMARGAIWQS